jgi:hypothetical protein
MTTWNDPAGKMKLSIPAGMDLVPSLPSDAMIAQGIRLGFTEQQTCELYCEMLNAYKYEMSAGCAKCGQKDIGQTGEYPCGVCGLPMLWDDKP